MKNRMINWTLKEREEINTIALKVIKNSIENNIENINQSLNELKNLDQERVILEINEEKSLDDLVKEEIIFFKKKEIEGEFVDIDCNLIPINYFTLKPYSSYIEYKNNILYSICNFIKGNVKSKNIEKYLCIFSINDELSIRDLDNYFCKPYLDGIVLSKLVVSDTAKNITVMYTQNKESNAPLNIKIISKNSIEKYIDIVRRCI